MEGKKKRKRLHLYEFIDYWEIPHEQVKPQQYVISTSLHLFDFLSITICKIDSKHYLKLLALQSEYNTEQVQLNIWTQTFTILRMYLAVHISSKQTKQSITPL